MRHTCIGSAVVMSAPRGRSHSQSSTACHHEHQQRTTKRPEAHHSPAFLNGWPMPGICVRVHIASTSTSFCTCHCLSIAISTFVQIFRREAVARIDAPKARRIRYFTARGRGYKRLPEPPLEASCPLDVLDVSRGIFFPTPDIEAAGAAPSPGRQTRQEWPVSHTPGPSRSRPSAT